MTPRTITRAEWRSAWRFARLRAKQATITPLRSGLQLLASNMRWDRDQPTPSRVTALPF